MRVLKFGGTSVGKPETIKQVIEIILSAQKECGQVAVVVSAFAGITNQIIKICQLAEKQNRDYLRLLEDLERRHLITLEALLPIKSVTLVKKSVCSLFSDLRDLFRGVFLIQEIPPGTFDSILSYGERLSAYIIAEGMKSRFSATSYLDASKLIKTNDSHGCAQVDFASTNHNIKEYFGKNPTLHIITGFIASTHHGKLTTLGRGGSDFTASIFAAALDAELVELWTDVDGVLTADPRMVEQSFPVSRLTYEEAMELAHFGAKVIYPPALSPAIEKNIPLVIKNTANPQAKGSFISSEPSPDPSMITGISSITEAALLLLSGSGLVGVVGTASRLFSALSHAQVNIILITQGSSEHSICLAVTPSQVIKAKKAIETEFSLELANGLIEEVVVEKRVSILAVVGENMRNIPGISGRLFSALGRNGVNVRAIAQGSSERNISCVINREDTPKALNILHESFFLSNTRTINIFLVGLGLIGKTLLKQIHEHLDVLRNSHNLEPKIVGLANSRKMLFDEKGVSLSSWHERLTNEGEPMSMDSYFHRMKNMNLVHSIFVDCTASEEVTSFYLPVLSNSITLVTPNKKGNASGYELYNALKKEAAKRNIQFLYETNVGAGLPILSTLNDLLQSGDHILKIEAVLSGTLSYIFNTYDGSIPFSEVVRTARERGFTEPDPRDDLNGLDVARKILILSRKCGEMLEMSDIEIESIMSPDCQNATSIEHFFKELKKMDEVFKKRVLKATAEGKKLRYLALYENKNASVRLQELGQTHPFYNLAGSDNILQITTRRYRENPLVIKGPGAGAEVTAAAVFADIIRGASR